MIEELKGIRIKGRCFKNDSLLKFYKNSNDRICIVFGKNGSGKSTVSEGIDSITKDNSNSDLSVSFIDSSDNILPYENESGIYVFNEKYVDENVKIDDDGLGTIVLLGDQVGLQESIESQKEKVNSLAKKMDDISNEYNKFQDKNNPSSPEYHQSRIIALLKKDGGWADIDSQIKGNRIKSQVTVATVKEIGEFVVKETLADLQNKFNDTQALLTKVNDSSISYPNSIVPVNIDTDFESKIIALLAQKIEEPVLSEREKQILDSIQKGFQDRIESAKTVFSRDTISICPYCYQPVTDKYKHDLIDSINKVLNKDVDEHKAQLNSIVFPKLEFDVSPYESLNAELVKSINQKLSVCKSLLLQYHEYVKQKIGNIYTPIIINPIGLSSEIQNLNVALNELETKRLEFNDASKRKESIISDLVSINKAIAHLQIAQFYRDFVKQEKDKIVVFKKLKKNQDDLENEKSELRRLQERKANTRLAIENINNSLSYVFLSHNRLSIELKNDKYYLKSNKADVLPKKVSQGERNIIALCYFFTQIFSNQEIGKLYQTESLIVIDDPVSSFDFENKIGIISFLRYQTDRIINGNPNSKILFLSHDLETVFALKKAMDEICKATKGTANKPQTTSITFELNNHKLCDFTKYHNEYGRLLKKIYHFANGDTKDDSLIIGNVMRRVLEAYSTFTYKKNIEMVSCDLNVKTALGDYSIFFENLMYRLVLHGESHYEEQVYGIHDGNSFYKFISDDEKVKTAKNILCFMYLLNSNHIIAYLQEVSGAIDNIRTWVKNIPKNDSFDITEHEPKLRRIPLYYLPLSGGVGNESFEGISYDDFETENEMCDFALKVSGDSMEPNIPDESIVLIKKQEIIDDGMVGAFYLNGKVYCKYLRYDNRTAYLCSYNDSYKPIEIDADDTVKVYGLVIEIIPPNK